MGEPNESTSRRIRRVTSDLQDRLRRLSEIGIALSAERSLDRLLDRILVEARRFTHAEAGTLYVRNGDLLGFAVVQNDRVPPAAVSADGRGQMEITRSSIAGYVAATGRVLNLRDVYDLPQDAEFTFNRVYDEKTGYETHSMLVVPMHEPSGPVNGVIQLINAVDPLTGRVVTFSDNTEQLCLSLASQAGVALHNAQLTRNLEQAYQETVWRLARAAEYRDSDTGAHIKRVAHFSEALALEVGMSAAEAQLLRLASPMHDVGKLGVPDAILKKAGRLTPEERELMEEHTAYGGEILAGSEVPLLRLSAEIALTHHERWDGMGYPRGLAGEAIPLSGRITAVADVFDALTSKRCYKDAMPVEKACAILEEGRGSHFEPRLVDAFLRILPQILDIRARFQDDTEPPRDDAGVLATQQA